MRFFSLKLVELKLSFLIKFVVYLSKIISFERLFTIISIFEFINVVIFTRHI